MSGATVTVPSAKGSARRIPVPSRPRDPAHGTAEAPAPGRCPYCGQVPGPSSTAWCPAFDELLSRAAGGTASA